ncbi:hypothetical protein ACFY4C_15025 [Actinomadura viridis]|uniref:hypothetical protein n=1 Tax=Actinomadura viridis TaxID=58110 RepID=UPI00368E3E46
MAHFLTLVFVEAHTEDPGAAAEAAMMPYFGERGEGGKADGFVIGGRYDGLVKGHEQHYNLTPAEFQRRYGLDVVRPESNIVPVTELPESVLPSAVVTPDGAWHEWRGHSDEDAWKAEYRRLTAAHRDALAVAIDCHC